MPIITVNNRDLDIRYTAAQNDVFFYDGPERYTVVPKGRRVGMTHGAALFCIEKLIEGKTILWVDTIQPNIYKYYYKYFRPTLKSIRKDYWGWQGQRQELQLCSGQIDFRSAEKPENIEGFAYDIIILNEAGIILKGKKGRSLWYNSIAPMTMDYTADVYFIGTPKGKKAKKDEAPEKYSLYYELALKGGYDTSLAPKEAHYRTVKLTSYQNPLIPEENIKELEYDIPHTVRKQEIYGEFLDAGDNEVFKEEWIHIVHELPPVHLHLRKVISWDTAFKAGAENDDSACIVALQTTVGIFIVYAEASKMEFPELLRRSNEIAEDNPDAEQILIEDKASGQSLIQMFQRQSNFPVKPIKPSTDKYSRACAVTPFFEQGKVFFLFGTWNNMLKNQLLDFNAQMDTPDDLVDAVSQLLNYFKSIEVPSKKIVSRKVRRTSKALKGY